MPDSKIKVYPDILFIPLVAFDNKLNRLGYGGGYYDRLIERLCKKKKIICWIKIDLLNFFTDSFLFFC